MPGLPSLDDVARDLEAQVQKDKEAGEAVEQVASVDQDIDDIKSKSNGNGGPTPDAIADALGDDESKDVTAAPAEKEKEKDKIGARFAALSRKEKEARQAREAVEAREKALADREKAIQEREDRIKAAKRPMEVLKAHGFDYTDASMDAVGGFSPKEPDPVDTKLAERLSPLDEKLKQLDEANAELKKQLADIQAERQQRAVQEMKYNISQTVKDKGYEYISAAGEEGIQLAFDVIGDFFRKHQRVLTYDEACNIVEAHYEKFATKLTGTNKARAKFAAPAASTQPPSKPSAKGKPATLTQGHSTTTVAKPTGVDHLSKADALEAIVKQYF